MPYRFRVLDEEQLLVVVFEGVTCDWIGVDSFRVAWP